LTAAPPADPFAFYEGADPDFLIKRDPYGRTAPSDKKRPLTRLHMAPIPLSKVRTLRSYSGLFWLCIECLECGRQTEIRAEALAYRFGRDALVSDVVKRLVCETCKAKDPLVLIGMKR
jgi:hypothetical protein